MTTVDTVLARARQYAVRAAVTTSKVRIRVAVGYTAARSALHRRLR